MKTGDAVTVHDPAWRDATGRVYEAGKHHGKAGVIVEETEYKVGPDRMYHVELEGGLVREFWTSELKPSNQGIKPAPEAAQTVDMFSDSKSS